MGQSNDSLSTWVGGDDEVDPTSEPAPEVAPEDDDGPDAVAVEEDDAEPTA
jgi:hypothetical protein